MAMDTLSAVNAYRNQMKLMQNASSSSEAEATASPFEQLVTEALSQTSESLKKNEALQMEAITGKVEITDLVTAVADAELTLNTVVAVRDRVINAYNDIIRMAI